jgi:hypothetical protein
MTFLLVNTQCLADPRDTVAANEASGGDVNGDMGSVGGSRLRER